MGLDYSFRLYFNKGLDYSFRLYFNKAQIWDVLQGVVEIGQPHHPPAHILFPNRVLEIPLDAWVAHSNEFHWDDPELQFATVLNFAEDEPLWEYVTERDHRGEEYRSPPDDGSPRMISIGYIYLYIYQDLSGRHPSTAYVVFLIVNWKGKFSGFMITSSHLNSATPGHFRSRSLRTLIYRLVE